MSTELALFALPNGAEVIGAVTEHNPGFTITLEHPLVIRPIQKKDGGLALDLFPHSLSNPEGKHIFFINQLLSRSESIPAQLEKAYLERTSRIILSGVLDAMEAKM
jgi:hypothetical protein